MKSNSTHLIQQKVRTAAVATVALALLLPAGLAGAAETPPTVVNVTAVEVKGASGIDTAAPDPSKVKFSKEAAIAKVKGLFPVLKDASVSSTELGSTRSYPPSPNQMVWNIQWQYQSGNTAYGFSSEVDAVNGDLISTNIHMPWQGDQSFYPPKVTEAQALDKARAFIAKAAASIKSSDLQLQDSPLYNFNSNALFGPIQYSFSFNILRNGLPSSADNLSIAIDGNGEVISYNKSSEGFVYPSSVPKVTQAQAEKSIKDSFDVGLYYIPIYKNGTPDSWLLSWAPVEQALYALDAHTGKKLTEEGKEAPSASVIYADVPKSKEVFQPRNSSVELTDEQAAKLVEKVGDIPAGRKLNNKILSEDYQNRDRKIWRLSWDAGQLTSGFPTQTSAEVDALSGEILSFQSEQFGLAMNGKGKASEAPAGAKKLTAAEAAQKATALVNALYPEASSTLKQIQYGGDWSVLPDGQATDTNSFACIKEFLSTAARSV